MKTQNSIKLMTFHEVSFKFFYRVRYFYEMRFFIKKRILIKILTFHKVNNTPTYLGPTVSLFKKIYFSKHFIRKQCYSQLLCTKEIFICTLTTDY